MSISAFRVALSRSKIFRSQNRTRRGSKWQICQIWQFLSSLTSPVRPWQGFPAPAGLEGQQGETCWFLPSAVASAVWAVPSGFAEMQKVALAANFLHFAEIWCESVKFDSSTPGFLQNSASAGFSGVELSNLTDSHQVFCKSADAGKPGVNLSNLTVPHQNFCSLQKVAASATFCETWWNRSHCRCNCWWKFEVGFSLQGNRSGWGC